MSTRLIVWNIQRFSINTINKITGQNPDAQLANIVQSFWNNTHIRTIAYTADIFVVIEVQSTRSVLGSLIGGKGAQGVLFLLEWLRLNYNANWCVVPPLKLVGLNDAGEASNYTEGVAVFFRNDRVNFTGPYIWPTVGNVAVPSGSATAGPYPDPWADALPANNYNAGQFQFFRSGSELLFVNGNNRRPFYTTFTELATGRTIKLVSVHPSPNSDRIAAVARFAGITEIRAANTPTVVAVAGDFNINLFSTKTTETQAYVPFTFSNFSQKFRTNTGATAGQTRVKKVQDATAASYLRHQALDNIFVRYDGGAAPPVLGGNNPRIIDSVIDMPGYPSTMLQSIANINRFYPTTVEREQQFREPPNFGHIGETRGASDHLPLVIDL